MVKLRKVKLRKTPREIELIRAIRYAKATGAVHLVPFYEEKLQEERSQRSVPDKRYTRGV